MWELLDGAAEHLDVVGRRVGASVSRPQKPRQRRAGLVQITQQWVETVSTLVRARRAVFVRVRGDQGGVDIQRDPRWTSAQPPRPSVAPRPG